MADRKHSVETVEDCLHRLFPTPKNRDHANGTSPYPPYFALPAADGSPAADYEAPPVVPFDVFAAAGYLLQTSGAYHHVIALVTDRGQRASRQIEVTPSFIAKARATASAWRMFNPAYHYDAKNPSVFAEWLTGEGKALNDLFVAWEFVWGQHGPDPVFEHLSRNDPPAAWWESALFLLMASDEASRGIGFAHQWTGDDAGDQPWVFTPLNEAYRKLLVAAATAAAAHASQGVTFEQINSISSASPDVACVLPKARTARVGCTLRSLSHHLALLPPRGVARAKWSPYYSASAPPDERHMNLLLVPFPYSIPAAAFKPAGSYAGEGSRRWSFFDVEQTWLDRHAKRQLVGFIEALATSAKKEADAVHGIVFPELALDDESWTLLCEKLPALLPELEFLIAGVSEDGGRSGNFVKVCTFQTHEVGEERETARIGVLSGREKHHRWTMERDEVLGYALEGRLSPSISWSENIDLLSRRVDFAVIRQSSVISAMICEDLARMDPCQELLRSIGPNIIFTLLMDAPQLKARWPARYATVLAEDPGSAVLTLTSRGLMTRQHVTGRHKSGGPEDRAIALWRDDDRSTPKEISCPIDAHAVRLTLSGVPVVDRTLDGREDGSAVAWRYAYHEPVRIDKVVEKYGDLLGPEDVSLQAAK